MAELFDPLDFLTLRHGGDALFLAERPNTGQDLSPELFVAGGGVSLGETVSATISFTASDVVGMGNSSLEFYGVGQDGIGQHGFGGIDRGAGDVFTAVLT